MAKLIKLAKKIERKRKILNNLTIPIVIFIILNFFSIPILACISFVWEGLSPQEYLHFLRNAILTFFIVFVGIFIPLLQSVENIRKDIFPREFTSKQLNANAGIFEELTRNRTEPDQRFLYIGEICNLEEIETKLSLDFQKKLEKL